MALEDLKTFIEARLRALDPGIDLDAGSPAQLQFIQPVLTRLGTDPFQTSIDSFITDRFAQEFPDVYADDPGVIRDTFIKPLIVLLEPFKREIQTIKRNQSLADPTVLSDEDAEALAANVFEERDSGGFSVGVGRVFFPNPTNVEAQTTTRFFTAEGLNFFPTNPVSITAEEMVFNRQGALFFFDVPLKAEQEGSEYNIAEEGLVGVDGLFGVVRVSNPREFKDGASKLDTASFVATARDALTERSLVTRRGATARVRQVFQTELRAAQVIGARDPEMQRDILVAASPGHAWIQGAVSMYGKVAYVQAHTIDGEESDAPVPGDELFVYLDKYRWPGLQQASRFVRFKVEELLGGPYPTTSNPLQTSYMVRVSGEFPTVGVVLPTVFNGGFSKKGTVRISSLPDIGEKSFSVANGEIHVFGHSDVYVRPILQPSSKAVLSGLYDSKSFIERTTLSTNGAAVSDKNRLQDASVDFSLSGVKLGDIVVLENGEDAGTYVVQKVVAGLPGTIFVDSNLTKTASNLRYRILRRITLNPFEPQIPRFPFGQLVSNDLSTLIGSTLITLSTNDIISFGAREGDVIRVKGGSNPTDYVITGFDATLGGRGPIIDRPAQTTESNLEYEVFTALETVERPLVRIKEIMLLDSSQQTTGITIPPADPIACVPTGEFSSARVRGGSQRKSGYVLPDLTPTALTTFFTASDTAAPATSGSVPTSDRRYSLGFDVPNGNYKPVFTTPDGGATKDYSEFDYRADAKTGCNYFLAIHEFEDEAENFPPIDPRPGECLRIKGGPNKGSYLIKAVQKFKYKLYGPNRIAWVYFIQIYGTFPVDSIKEVIELLNDVGGGAAVTELPINGEVEFPTFFKNLYNSFGTKLQSAFTSMGLGSPPTTAQLQSIFESITQVEYEWGDPARGVLRSYFIEPVLFEQSTGDAAAPTKFSFKTETGDLLKFRPDPTRYIKQQLVPARLNSDAAMTEYPRDLDASVSGTATFTDPDRPSIFSIGVQPGDVLEVHEEVFLHGSAANRSAVRTVASSAQVTLQAGAIFTSQMVGNLFFIEQGADAGGYRIVKYIDAQNVLLDKALTVTTPNVLASGAIASWGYDGTNNVVTASGGVDFSTLVNRYITIFGMNYTYQGSYKIVAGSSLLNARVERVGNFPATAIESAAFWMVTDAPETAPSAVGTGTELYGMQAVRMYQSVPEEMSISAVSSNPAISQATIPTGLLAGIDQPFRIVRKNVRRVTPTEMFENRDGAYFFFDTEVVSLDPLASANLQKESYLTVDDGTYKSDGYKHLPDDPTLTYSTKETGKIELPVRILPVDSEDSPENFLNLFGAPVQVTYEQAETVRLLQDFLDSPQDRVTTANMLARHFLPAYVSYDAEYTGGSAAGVIAKDIISYIDTVPVEQPIDVSKIQDLIASRGGNPDTPTKVMVVLHDWSRKAWLEFSENQVGGVETKVPYNGTPRVSYFSPGADVSGEEEQPYGERVNLVRR